MAKRAYIGEKFGRLTILKEVARSERTDGNTYLTPTITFTKPFITAIGILQKLME